jgi:hypothetical protein
MTRISQESLVNFILAGVFNFWHHREGYKYRNLIIDSKDKGSKDLYHSDTY